MPTPERLDLDAMREGHYERMPQVPRRCMCGDLWPCSVLELADEVARLRAIVDTLPDLRIELVDNGHAGARCKVWRDGYLVFDGRRG